MITLPPETTQAPPASPIFDPRYWVPLTRAFGQFMSMIEAHDHALICINRDIHEGRLRLVLMAPDGMTREPDAAERQKLTVHAAHNFEEGVWIEPFHEGRWYVCRSDLAKLTTIPATPVKPDPPKPKLAKAEPTRWKLDRTIQAIRLLYPLDGRPKESIAALTKRINKLPDFKGDEVSEDTVRRADLELKAARKK